MKKGKYDFEPHTDGDTSEAVTFTITLPIVDGQQLSLEGAEISAKFRDQKTNKSALTISVGDGITITDADAGEFKVDTGALSPLPCGNYAYDMQFVFTTGHTFTYLYGTKIVYEDLTRE